MLTIFSVCRMLFGFSRDQAVPFSSTWQKVDESSGVPCCAGWPSFFRIHNSDSGSSGAAFTITNKRCLPSTTSLLTQHARFPAVWGVTGASFILGLPLLNGITAFSATTSIACAGLALTYSLPILLRILFRASYLEGGPFTLGRCAANS